MAVTIVALGVGAIGVARTIFGEDDTQCACLGTWLNLPLTKVTLLENSLMVAMAVILLVR